MAMTTSSARMFLSCILFSLTTTVIAQSSPVSYYIMAIQYAPALCSDPKETCISSIPRIPTIHGLWTNTDKDLRNPPVKNPANKFSTTKFPNLLPDMVTKWPSVLTSKTDKHFWEHEWIKHGSKSDFDKKTFFEKTLAVYDFVNLMSRAMPGSYTMQAIDLQLSTAYGGAVTTVCRPTGTGIPATYGVSELRFNITFDSAGNPQVNPSKLAMDKTCLSIGSTDLVRFLT